MAEQELTYPGLNRRVRLHRPRRETGISLRAGVDVAYGLLRSLARVGSGSVYRLMEYRPIDSGLPTNPGAELPKIADPVRSSIATRSWSRKVASQGTGLRLGTGPVSQERHS